MTALFVERDPTRNWVAIIGGERIGGFKSEADAKRFVRAAHFQYQTYEDFLAALREGTARVVGKVAS